MGDKIRWGIVGTGDIARQFAEDLHLLDEAALVAVGSRAQASADRFADTHNIPRRHPSYEALAADPEVDVVYIGTPHPLHCENTLLCLAHGKPVLCEKPFALSTVQAQRMCDAAREHQLFLMEAMWTYCFPAVRKLVELLENRAIGDVRLMEATFCYQAAYDPKSRLFDPALGGGTLLDLGVYPLALMQLVFGDAPKAIITRGHLGETGVDEQLSVIAQYPDGALAVFSSALRIDLPQVALIGGTEGHIVLPRFSQPDTLELHRKGRESETFHFDRLGYGYSFEAREVMRCLRAGAVDSRLAPLSNTLARMRMVDTLRAALGLTYPMEEEATLT